MSNVFFATELTKPNVLRAILNAYGRPLAPRVPARRRQHWLQPVDNWFADGPVRPTIGPDVDAMAALPYESLQVLIGPSSEAVVVGAVWWLSILHSSHPH